MRVGNRAIGTGLAAMALAAALGLAVSGRRCTGASAARPPGVALPAPAAPPWLLEDFERDLARLDAWLAAPPPPRPAPGAPEVPAFAAGEEDRLWAVGQVLARIPPALALLPGAPRGSRLCEELDALRRHHAATAAALARRLALRAVSARATVTAPRVPSPRAPAPRAAPSS